MKYFRLLEDNKKIRLLVQLDEETIVDLTSIHSDLTDIIQIVLTSNIYSTSITKTTEKILNNKSYETYKIADIINSCKDVKPNLKMLTPISSPDDENIFVPSLAIILPDGFMPTLFLETPFNKSFFIFFQPLKPPSSLLL